MVPVAMKMKRVIQKTDEISGLGGSLPKESEDREDKAPKMTAKFQANILRKLFSKTKAEPEWDWEDHEFLNEFRNMRKSIKPQVNLPYKNLEPEAKLGSHNFKKDLVVIKIELINKTVGWNIKNTQQRRGARRKSCDMPTNKTLGTQRKSSIQELEGGAKLNII